VEEIFMQSLRRRIVLLMLGLLYGIVLLSSAVSAQATSKPAASSAPGRGRVTFQETCAVCHGEKGKGNGPAASSLTVHPADLTKVTKPGEAFPAAHVEAVLKGTDTTGAHTNVMMMWRALFFADANGSETAAAARISDLVAFIESIQVKPSRNK
jgi:hypothetical protein